MENIRPFFSVDHVTPESILLMAGSLKSGKKSVEGTVVYRFFNRVSTCQVVGNGFLNHQPYAWTPYTRLKTNSIFASKNGGFPIGISFPGVYLQGVC